LIRVVKSRSKVLDIIYFNFFGCYGYSRLRTLNSSLKHEIYHCFDVFWFQGLDVAATFKDMLQSNPSMATAIAAIRTLILVLEKCPAR